MPTSKALLEWQKANRIVVALTIPNKSGIPDALLQAIEDMGVTKNAYCLEAVRQRLVRDGYLEKVLPGDGD